MAVAVVFCWYFVKGVLKSIREDFILLFYSTLILYMKRNHVAGILYFPSGDVVCLRFASCSAACVVF
jgi:hypothetical protein